MKFFSSRCDGTKVKTQLKLAASRIAIDAQKRRYLIRNNMREVAELYAEHPAQEEKARLRTEALIRDDNTTEALEILKLECELLAERIKLLEHCKECPPDLVSCISDLMYASTRVEIPELDVIRKQFKAKYGKVFKDNAMKNTGNILNPNLVSKLAVEAPPAELIQSYATRICKLHGVMMTVRLSGDDIIIEPVPEHPVELGTPNIDEEINFRKGQNLATLSVLPPPPPSAVPGLEDSSVSSNSSSSSSPPPGYGDAPPVENVQYVPRVVEQSPRNDDEPLITVTAVPYYGKYK